MAAGAAAALDARMRALQFWDVVTRTDRQADIVLVDGTAVSAVLAAVDSKQRNYHVRHLATSLGEYPTATLRAADVACASLTLSAAEASALLRPPASSS
mmetsp:Transcript_21690/g.76175  ORF Transcript_21690/g.76175 Transcript_21690/m.76175 type:complete len:99 (+) Transcript_21690:176-472(+)